MDKDNYLLPKSSLGQKILMNQSTTGEIVKKESNYNEMDDINYLIKLDKRLDKFLENAKLDKNIIENGELQIHEEESNYIKNKIKKLQESADKEYTDDDTDNMRTVYIEGEPLKICSLEGMESKAKKLESLLQKETLLEDC